MNTPTLRSVLEEIVRVCEVSYTPCGIPADSDETCIDVLEKEWPDLAACYWKAKKLLGNYTERNSERLHEVLQEQDRLRKENQLLRQLVWQAREEYLERFSDGETDCVTPYDLYD